MAGESRVTTDHDEIRRWAEERGGRPTIVKGTSDLLRIDFPGYTGEETLEPITWDEFFEKVDENNLAFLYQDRTKDGQVSRFFKLVDRGTVSDRPARSRQSGRATKAAAKAGAKKGAAKKAAAKKTGVKRGAAAKATTKKSAASASRRTAGRTASTKKAGKTTARGGTARKGTSKTLAKSSAKKGRAGR
jgi:hypothetical protein